MFDEKIAKVLDSQGQVVNTLVLKADADPSEWGAVWDESLTLGLFEHKARQERDRRLLEEVDSITNNPLRYASLSDEEKTALAQKRQALLDVPQQEGFPIEIVWP